MGDERIERFDVESAALGSVPCVAVLPPHADTAGLPLCLALHGGGSDREGIVRFAPVFEEMWANGRLAPMVIASASTGPLSWYAGPWEEFVATEFPDVLAARYGSRTDRGGMVMTGISMGGYGTLKIGLRRPDHFCALAAMEAAIDPGVRPSDRGPRNTFYRFEEVDQALWGHPVDEAAWQRDNPANIAIANADAIRSSGLEIYLECGDQDSLNLHDGAEFMHRVLWDHDIRHEFHLVRWADHVGPSFGVRMAEVMQFLSNALDGGLSAPSTIDPTPDEQAWMEWRARGATGDTRPAVDLGAERGPALLRMQFAPGAARAEAEDPTWQRAYGVMPPS